MFVTVIRFYGCLNQLKIDMHKISTSQVEEADYTNKRDRERDRE